MPVVASMCVSRSVVRGIMSGKSSISRDSDDKRYDLVPPEGGWGYAVCVGLSVIFIAGTAHQPVFGFIYNDFLNDLGVGTGAVSRRI
ncbi:unnamed protein product [Leptidea sinapis]|uniref:Monocarboxylate transporter n=1 Tax=Leptidea sinapis TaxID=189913 RepID=A0A5E4QDQ2_9NEOP|nr:unnamed protein product [Leptidea sinapis]